MKINFAFLTVILFTQLMILQLLTKPKQEFLIAPIQEKTNLGLFQIQNQKLSFVQSLKYEFKKTEPQPIEKK